MKYTYTTHMRRNKIDYVIKVKLSEIKYDVKFDSWHKETATKNDVAYDDDDAEALR